MNRKGLNRLQAKVNAATDELARAINESFPVGSQVIADTGMGRKMRGTVAFAAKTTDVAVRSQQGKVHWKHHSSVEAAQ